MKLILKTDDPRIEGEERTIRNILMDALAEFASNRGPSAEEYVNKRYPNTEEYAWLNRKDKITQVIKRKILAEKIRNEMNFEIVLDNEEDN